MDIEAALHRQLPELPPDAAAGSRTGTPCRVIDSDTAAAVVLSPALKRAMKEAGAVGPRRSPRLHQSPRCVPPTKLSIATLPSVANQVSYRFGFCGLSLARRSAAAARTPPRA